MQNKRFVKCKKYVLFFSLLCTFEVFGLHSFLQAHNSKILQKVFNQDDILLKKSIDFIAKNYFNTYTTDKTILSNWILKVYSNPYLKTFVQNAYASLKQKPDNFNPNFLRLVDENYVLIGHLCLPEKSESEMDCMMLQSIWCDKIPPQNDLLKKLDNVLEDATSTSSADIVSHVLFILSELQKKSCLKSDSRDVLMEKTKKFLTTYIDKKSDSYGEGIAMLFHAGFAEQVKGIWIDKIRKTLQKKIKTTCYSCSSEPHDMLLEVYSLSQWYALKK